MHKNNDYPVIVKSYNLTLWYIKKISTLPRSHRFTLGQSIQQELVSLLMSLTEAIYSKEKKDILKKANLHIEKIRLLTKLLKDLEILSEKNRRFAGENLIEIGSMVGGWIKNAK